jgi:hypothetical protein
MKGLTRKWLAFFIFLLALSPISAPSASASSPTIYESMSGTDTSTLSGTASSNSVGLTGNWTLVNAFKLPDATSALSPLYTKRFNAQLAFPSSTRYLLPDSNTAASTDPEIYRLYYAYRTMQTGINFDSSSTFYFSFLDYVPNINGSPGSAMIGLLNGAPTTTTDDSKNVILMGRTYSGAPTIQVTKANYAAWNVTPYSAQGAANSGTSTDGKSWFVIAKITTVASGNDSIQLKFYADSDAVPSSDAAISWDVTYSVALTGTYSYLAVQTESDGTIDEVRGGPTYDAVSGVAIPPTIGAPTVSGAARKGTSTTATVTSGAAGIFRFYLDGKRVPACLSQPTSGSAPNFTASCTWKPPVVGNHQLSATFTSLDPGYTNTSSARTNLTVLPRQGVR